MTEVNGKAEAGALGPTADGGWDIATGVDAGHLDCAGINSWIAGRFGYDGVASEGACLVSADTDDRSAARVDPRGRGCGNFTLLGR